MIDLAPWQWVLGAICAYLSGVSKTGVPGLGILVVPLMALMLGDAKQSTGWLLPILCTADLFAVYQWRKHAATWRLFSLAPWVVLGMITGTAALSFNERLLRPIIATVILAMLSLFIVRRYRAKQQEEVPSHGPTYGIFAGFATTVANSAGPVMNLYLLSRRLPKQEFIATGAMFFFAINLSKIPIYLWHQTISERSLIFDLSVVPAVALGAATGRWIVHHIPQHFFEISIIVLAAIATLMLFR